MMSDFHIRSNLQVAQNGRFVINPIYSRGSTMVAKFLDFGLSESLKMHSLGAFCSPKLSLESRILHSLPENFPEYLPNITIGTSTSIIVYLIPQHLFHGSKITNCSDFKTLPDVSFACVKTISAFVDTDLKLMMKMVDKSNVHA